MRGFIKLAKKRYGLDWINPDLNNFENHINLKKIKYEIVTLKDTCYEDALKEIYARGLRPASFVELCLWPDWDRETQVNAIGTLVFSDGEYRVPVYCTHSVCGRRDSWLDRSLWGEYVCKTLRRFAELSIKMRWHGTMHFLVVDDKYLDPKS